MSCQVVYNERKNDRRVSWPRRIVSLSFHLLFDSVPKSNLKYNPAKKGERCLDFALNFKVLNGHQGLRKKITLTLQPLSSAVINTF